MINKMILNIMIENIEKYLTHTHNHQMDQDRLHIQKFMNLI